MAVTDRPRDKTDDNRVGDTPPVRWRLPFVRGRREKLVLNYRVQVLSMGAATVSNKEWVERTVRFRIG
jgi:hypothetical protein